MDEQRCMSWILKNMSFEMQKEMLELLLQESKDSAQVKGPWKDVNNVSSSANVSEVQGLADGILQPTVKVDGVFTTDIQPTLMIDVLSSIDASDITAVT